jgi:hypothetical protein
MSLACGALDAVCALWDDDWLAVSFSLADDEAVVCPLSQALSANVAERATATAHACAAVRLDVRFSIEIPPDDEAALLSKPVRARFGLPAREVRSGRLERAVRAALLPRGFSAWYVVRAWCAVREPVTASALASLPVFAALPAPAELPSPGMRHALMQCSRLARVTRPRNASICRGAWTDCAASAQAVRAPAAPPTSAVPSGHCRWFFLRVARWGECTALGLKQCESDARDNRRSHSCVCTTYSTTQLMLPWRRPLTCCCSVVRQSASIRAAAFVRRLFDQSTWPIMESGKGQAGEGAMVESAAQRKATLKYRKEHMKQLAMRFYPADMDLWEHLEKQPSKAAYVK